MLALKIQTQLSINHQSGRFSQDLRYQLKNLYKVFQNLRI